MCGTDLNNKEKLFLALSWVPKATVQAALSSEIYEGAKAAGLETYTTWGDEVITLCIFFILISAPLGAALISIFGTILLPYGNEFSDEDKEIKPNQIIDESTANNEKKEIIV